MQVRPDAWEKKSVGAPPPSPVRIVSLACLSVARVFWHPRDSVLPIAGKVGLGVCRLAVVGRFFVFRFFVVVVSARFGKFDSRLVFVEVLLSFPFLVAWLDGRKSRGGRAFATRSVPAACVARASASVGRALVDFCRQLFFPRRRCFPRVLPTNAPVAQVLRGLRKRWRCSTLCKSPSAEGRTPWSDGANVKAKGRAKPITSSPCADSPSSIPVVYCIICVFTPQADHLQIYHDLALSVKRHCSSA